MNFLFWGLTLGVIGKMMLGIGVLIAHTELVRERRIDLRVLKSYRIEHALTITGLVLIMIGYGMELHFYNFLSLLDCSESECIQAASVIMSQ